MLGTIIRSLNIEPQRAQGTWGTTPLPGTNKGKLKSDNREWELGSDLDFDNSSVRPR